MMELLTNPATWVGLATLVILEIVLGIDNLVFIAILAEKLPPHQRDKARIIGLSLALVMRLGLLSVVSWIVTLTTPLFSLAAFSFSGRDLIMLFGGLFLLFKATTELHERLEGVAQVKSGQTAYASFAAVIAQIVVLDAVFSLDAVITAVGMVDELPVMMAAVVISVVVMLAASKPLTRFVNAHPTVVVLCLSFLLMIGLSLVAEGLGFHLPKAYLYAAIGFSILIEFFNHWAHRNALRNEARVPMRQRTAESVIRLLGGRTGALALQQEEAAEITAAAGPAFAPAERNMVSGVLALGERHVRSVMTPRSDVSWVNLEDDPIRMQEQLLASPHAMFPVCAGSLDKVIGVARAKELLGALMRQTPIDAPGIVREPIFVHEGTGVISLIETLRQARGQMALVMDEYGMLKGVVTPIDVLEAIAGEFPDEDEQAEIQQTGAREWLVAGSADLHQLELALGVDGLVGDGRVSSLAGFLLAQQGCLPEPGASLHYQGLVFQVLQTDSQRIERVRIVPAEPAAPD